MRLDSQTIELFKALAKSVELPLKAFVIDMLKGYIEIGMMLTPPAFKDFDIKNN